MAPSVHTHLHKAQRDAEPRYSRAHPWHNKSRAGSMFALSPRHIPFARDISPWRRVFPLLEFRHSHRNSYLLLTGMVFFSTFPLLFLPATCRRSPVACRSQCFAAESDLMSPTRFNPCKYRQQIHNLMIQIMKTGYKLSTGSARLVLFTSSGAESL